MATYELLCTDDQFRRAAARLIDTVAIAFTVDEQLRTRCTTIDDALLDLDAVAAKVAS